MCSAKIEPGVFLDLFGRIIGGGLRQPLQLIRVLPCVLCFSYQAG